MVSISKAYNIDKLTTVFAILVHAVSEKMDTESNTKLYVKVDCFQERGVTLFCFRMIHSWLDALYTKDSNKVHPRL